MRLLSDILIEWMQKRMTPTPTSGQTMFGSGTVSDIMSGGMYLVSTEKGAYWLNSVTDESIQVGDTVWVGYAGSTPFLIGKQK